MRLSTKQVAREGSEVRILVRALWWAEASSTPAVGESAGTPETISGHSEGMYSKEKA